VADRASKSKIMSEIAIEMRKAIIALAGERGWGETRERWLERAARQAGVSYRTAKSIFYSELRDPRTSIVTLVRHAAERLERKSAIQEDTARDTFNLLDARIKILENRLAAIDQDVNRSTPVEFSNQPDGTSVKDSAVD
jgi:hypothetical protein